MSDAPQENRKLANEPIEAPTPLTSNEEMSRYSSGMADLRSGGHLSASSLPHVEIEFDAPVSGDLRTLPALPGDQGGDEPLRTPFHPLQPGYEAPWNKPGPGEVDPKIAHKFRQILDDMVIRPPDAMDKLPSPADQAALKQQAQFIAGLIGLNGDFYAGMKREQVEDMFEAATGAGEENLNFLVRSVNEELAKRGSNVQLGYKFGSDKAWYAKQVAGDLYSKPFSVDENHSTVALMRRGPNGFQTEDRIRSRSTFDLPGYEKAQDPESRLKLMLERTGTPG